MTENCPVPTPTERRISEIIMRADKTLADAVALSLEAATAQTAAELKAMGEEGSAPALEYFASVIHQRMYCLMCGADPDTFEGGDPKIAYHVIRNSRNIAKQYWSADIEPYLPTRRFNWP